MSKITTFESSDFFFKLFRFLNEDSPCLAKNFSAGISKLKIAVFVSKNQWKNQTSESFLFFQFLQKFERTFTVLGEKLFGRDIKIENCSLGLIRSNKKSNFWKISFFFKIFRILNEHLLCLVRKFLAGLSKLKNAVFVSLDQPKNQTTESSVYLSNSSEIWTSIYRAWPKSFGQGYQNWKLQSSSQKINQKIKLLKVLFIYRTLKNFEWTITVLDEKVSGRDIKIENCTLCLQSIMLGIKIFFIKFCKFSFYSDLEYNCFGFEATEFSTSLSKIQSTCLYDFSLRCWFWKWNSLKRKIFWNLAEKFWPLC